MFYRKGENLAIMVVPVETEPVFSVGTPSVAYAGGDAGFNEPTYAVSRDGRQLLVMKNANLAEQRPEATALVVVNNWFEELNRLAPPSP